MDLAREITAAEARIRSRIRETPLAPSPALSAGTGGTLHLKLEQLQHTGSFKARGALSKVLALDEGARARGVITASSGNHGAAVAWALGLLGLRARIVVAASTDPSKVEAIRALGGVVEFFGDDSGLAELEARRVAEREGLVYISPYNDPQVIGGQGTIGVELARQLPRADAVYIALGGGGLLAGVGTWLRAAWPGVRIVGASPEQSAVMIASVRAGRVVELPSGPTLSDGTAGGVEPGAITLGPCAALADALVTVSEAAIAGAMRQVHAAHGHRIEGAAGVAVAAALADREAWRGGTAVAVVCGGNIAPDRFAAALAAG